MSQDNVNFERNGRYLTLMRNGSFNKEKAFEFHLKKDRKERAM